MIAGESHLSGIHGDGLISDASAMPTSASPKRTPAYSQSSTPGRRVEPPTDVATIRYGTDRPPAPSKVAEYMIRSTAGEKAYLVAVGAIPTMFDDETAQRVMTSFALRPTDT